MTARVNKTIWVIIGIIAVFVYLKLNEEPPIELPLNDIGACCNYVDNLRCSSNEQGCMPDPSAVFCTCMDGKTTYENTPRGQRGYCLVEGVTFTKWDYYSQNCR